MKKLILSLLLSCFATAGMSQDSLTYAIIKQALLEDSLAREEMRFNRDGIFMPLRGIIQTFTHRSFNRLPGPFVNKEKHPEDWGVALSPLAATWVMKAFGVKSRSTTRRMLTANGLALGLTVGLSQTLRWSVTEERPDHSDSHGLPSMHASLAFMGATVLSREYGHISHWITIGGYAAATGTQMLRIGHNRHWMNDIFLGAGIGVVSTHLAYYLTDKILGRKGIATPFQSYQRRRKLSSGGDPFSSWEEMGEGIESGSGFRLVSGTETNGRTLDVADFAETASDFDMTDVKLRSSASITSGFEAEWAVTPSISLSAIGRYTLSQAKLEIPSPSITAWGEQIHIYHGNVALGWFLPPLVQKKGGSMRFGTRTLWGVRYNEGVTFRRVAQGMQMGENLLYIKPQLRAEGGAGIVIDMQQSHNQTVGFSFDYLHTFGTRFLANRWVIASTWKALF
ncbi:MAG: phosphatase PAP2 family protein [Bacteroidaceae bacterium]|nr:phosphatase PAP2 family protein [Bacteroidaceae bacterium]